MAAAPTTPAPSSIATARLRRTGSARTTSSFITVIVAYCLHMTDPAPARQAPDARYVTVVTWLGRQPEVPGAVTRPSAVCSLLRPCADAPKHIPIVRTPSSGERMVTGSAALTTSTPVLSDAALVERIAALGDRAALAELDARHGMTLYAIAYTLLLNPDAADVTVAATLREAWRRAASFNAREQTAGRWLAELARKAARDQLRRSAMPAGGPPTRRRSACA